MSACKNGNEKFISITALINLLFMVMPFLLFVSPPVFILLFLSGMAVTISGVALMHVKVMVKLLQKQLHGKYGHPFTTIKPFHTTYGHKG